MAGQGDRARPETVFAPPNFAGLQLDTAQVGTGFLASVISVQKAVVVNARRIMVGKHVVGGPDFLDAIVFDAQENGARLVARRKKNLVADDQWRGGADRGVDFWPPGKIEKHLAVRRIQSDQGATVEKEGITPVVECGGDRR